VRLLEILKGNSNNDDDIDRRKNGVNKVLNAPVHLGSLAATLEAQVEQIKSIWVTTRDDVMVMYSCISFILKNISCYLYKFLIFYCILFYLYITGCFPFSEKRNFIPKEIQRKKL